MYDGYLKLRHGLYLNEQAAEVAFSTTLKIDSIFLIIALTPIEN